MSQPAAIEEALAALRALSVDAARAAAAVIPAIARHGEAVTASWLQAARKLSAHDRDSARAFIEGSAAAESASEEVLPWTEQAATFTRWPGCARAVEAFMRELPAAYAALGHAGERRWAELGLRWCERHLDSGRAYFAVPVRELSGRQGVAGIEQILDCAEELYESRHLMLVSYLQGALRVRNLLGAQAVTPWAMRGSDIMQAGRARGEAYFRLESEESLRLLLDSLPGFRPVERSRLLSLLVEVWFGETIELKESAWTPEKGRPFIECDGQSLMLPPVLTDQDETVLAILHSAGSMIHGSYDPDDVRRMFELSGLPVPNLGDPISMDPLFARFGDDAQRFKLLFDLVEDLRVDAAVGRNVPNHLKRMLRAGEALGVPPDPAGSYYRYALDSLRLALGQPNELSAEEQALLASVLSPQAGIAVAFEVALKLFSIAHLPEIDSREAAVLAYLPGRSPNASRAFQPRERSTDAQSGESEGEQGEGDQDQQEAGDQEQSESAEGQSEREESSETDEQQATGTGTTTGVGSSRRRAEEQAGKGGSSDKGIPYPEWDYREQRLKRNWAWVQEKKLAESNLGEARRLEQEYAIALKKLKQALQSQKPTRLAPRRRQFEGEDIDLEAAISYVTEREAGMSPEATVYRRRELKQREVSVILLADLSTSIMQLLPEGRGRLVDRVRAGILLFAESLEMVGDSYAIAGFCSKYRDNVAYYRIKDFDEPWSIEVKAQVGGLSGRLATRMGTAIRHATACFNGVSSRRRLLLLVSDGRPEDYDDGGDRRYLHEDTRMAVKEAVARGVHPYCITVDTLANEYLPQIFGRGHYLVLDHINSLPRRLPEIYLKLRR
ncbi:MAG: VWA domain-containing protein [Burkholderiales bacterium]|nr:VWA domain-containing protein [Burkholderiales bacterium]